MYVRCLFPYIPGYSVTEYVEKKKKEKEKLPYLKLKSLAFYTFSVN